MLADNQPVTLTAKCVTYASTDFFYLEEDSRSMGIRVEKAAHGLAVGMRADVTGTMKTNTNRERYVLATTAIQNGEGTVEPYVLRNDALGGEDWCVNGTKGQRGVTGAIGLNNVGLLVRTTGRYEQIDSTTFTIDDGTGLNVRCMVPSGTFLFSGWQYVAVTGIASSYKFNSAIYPPTVLVCDVRVIAPTEIVSVPGTPAGEQTTGVDESWPYTATGSACNQSHPVEYSFDWDDGTSSPWSSVPSASHSWGAAGAFTVTVTARCTIHPDVSATSPGLVVNVVGPTSPGQMVYIPAGSFLMGNNGGEPFTWADELPQHSVYLPGYWIGQYEVTRGEYRQFMKAGGYTNPAYWSSDGWSWRVSNGCTQPSYWAAAQTWHDGHAFTQTESHPVVGVNYYEAEAFCNWAGGCLPTQAQWEKSARWDGHPHVYPWGDVWDDEKCNNRYDHNPAGGGYKKYQSSPVGMFPSGASPYGCQDMAGNAWEWCQDWGSHDYYSQTPAEGWSDPQGPSRGSSRVLRGQGWGQGDEYTRCAYRDWVYPYRPCYTYWESFGFRLAR